MNDPVRSRDLLRAAALLLSGSRPVRPTLQALAVLLADALEASVRIRLERRADVAVQNGASESHSAAVPIAYSGSSLGELRIGVERAPDAQMLAAVESCAMLLAARLHDEERRREAHRLERLALTDALTGVPNRRAFDRHLEREWLRARRSGASIALLMIDVDRFKSYNDRFGHPAGDRALRAVATIGARTLKRPGDHFARYGGEEFVALLPETTREGAFIVAQAIREAIEVVTPERLPNGGVTVSIGIGVTATPRGSEFVDLIRAADEALYLAKESGRNRVCGPDDANVARSAPRLERLPSWETTFVGYDADLRAIGAALARHALVTVTGLGGVGKTRAVAEFARRHAGLFRDGVWFVDLSELEADADVAPFVCDVLRELAPLARSLEELAAAVADRHALIVLDGCDRVREAVARFAAALPASDAAVRVVGTAHEAFGIAGEHVHALGPLALADGVELLVDRARDAGAYVDEARQATMAAIVQHLDALPLAIELAAPQLRTLAPSDLLAQIDQGLAAFDRTVDAVFDWSRRLLDFDEERVFRRLAIFAGQFTIEGAIRVCALDADRNEATIASAVERLAAKSLISRDASMAPPRFSHLEIGRLYAQRLLIEAGEFEASSESFVRYHVALAERLEGALGMMPAATWYELVEADAQNIRYALAVALEWGLLEEAAIICRCIHTWFLERGALVTGDLRDRLAAALDTSDLSPSTEGALALALAALLRTDEPALAYDLARRAYDCYRAARDPLRIADALRSIVATELLVTGRVDPSIDEELLEAIDASLEFGSTIRAAELLNNLGVAYAQDEEPSRLHDALECFERSTALLDARGDRDRSGRVIGNAAAVAFFLGDLKLAVRRSGQAVEILERARAMPSSARQLANHGYYLFTDRRFDEARDALLRALAQLRDVNDRSGLVSAFEYLALFAHARGDDLRALRFFGFADTLLGSKFVRQARKADLLEPVMAQIRRNVGDELFEATMRLGATLSLEQAVQEAYD